MSVGDVDSNERGSGARSNDGKVRLDLVPLSALEDCARVFDYGRKKYAAWNWAKGMDWSVPYGCALRHLSAWFNGEDNDPESGLPHIGHVMCNLVMLSTFARTYPEGDDRPVRWLSGEAAFDVMREKVLGKPGFSEAGFERDEFAFVRDTDGDRFVPPLDPATAALVERLDASEEPTTGLRAGKADEPRSYEDGL